VFVNRILLDSVVKNLFTRTQLVHALASRVLTAESVTRQRLTASNASVNQDFMVFTAKLTYAHLPLESLRRISKKVSPFHN